jgi:hypothetical protein
MELTAASPSLFRSEAARLALLALWRRQLIWSVGLCKHMEPPLEIHHGLLVGHWRAVYGPLTVDWVFHDDRTFSGSVTRRREPISEFTGTWGLQGTCLHSEYTSDTSGAIDVGYIDRDVFLEFSHNHFVIQTRTGKRRYDRVQ